MIHPQDETELRGLLYLSDDEPLPAALESLYLRVQRCRNRRYGGPMALDLLLMIVMQAGLLPGGPQPAQRIETDAEVYHVGDEVEVLYGDEWQPGTVKGRRKDGVMVQIEKDSAPYRVIKLNQIRVLEHA